MTRENAFYQRIKLLCGDWESYNEWLDTYLEIEDPLSDILIKLIDCRNDIKETLHQLNLYCLEKPFDEESVYNRLREELYNKYEQNQITKDGAVSALHRISQNIPFGSDFQNYCNVLSDYYDLAINEIVNMKNFDDNFKKWLKNGGKIDWDTML